MIHLEAVAGKSGCWGEQPRSGGSCAARLDLGCTSGARGRCCMLKRASSLTPPCCPPCAHTSARPPAPVMPPLWLTSTRFQPDQPPWCPPLPDAARAAAAAPTDHTGQVLYADSIESLVRNEIQKTKIEMANEVIDAGRQAAWGVCLAC